MLKKLKPGRQLQWLLPFIFLLASTFAVKGANSVESYGIKDVIVTGQVLDDKGVPLPGVSVQVKESTAGTVTDANGNFTISVPNPNAVLLFSSVGFTEQEYPLKGQTNVTIAMVAAQQIMDQVVVIGYGTARKGDLTSSIATVKPEELKKTPSGALLNAVQGNVTGVQISSLGGPGDAPQINIRGIKSLYGGNIFLSCAVVSKITK